MVSSYLFYCLNCEQLKETEKAASVFKTGFYRTEYPLGCCRECNDNSKRPEERDVPSHAGA